MGNKRIYTWNGYELGPEEADEYDWDMDKELKEKYEKGIIDYNGKTIQTNGLNTLVGTTDENPHESYR